LGTFEVLPHTADVGFRAAGDSLADVFETAARAMFSVEYDLATAATEEERHVEVEADDLEGLLEIWLSELLWLHDATGFVPGTIAVREIGPDAGGGSRMRVVGTAGGRFLGDWFEQTGPQIKAVTLHGLEVRRVDHGWEATVYLDV
jgi:SHS2 domain-containing protein